MADSELTAERTRLVEILLDEPFSDRSLDELPWLVETLASTDAVALLLSDIAWLDRLLRRDRIAGLAFAARSRFWAPAAMEACVHVCLGVIDSAGIDFVASAIRLLDALGSTVAAAEALSARRQGGVPLDDEALSAAADCYLAAGRFDDALSALRELRTMSRDAAREIAVQERAGAVALAAGDHVASIALFEEAVAAHEARGDRHSAARARANLGLARMAGGAPRSGLRELSRAEREARLRGDYELLALALGGQGRAYRLLGAPRPALEKLGVEAAYWRRSGSAARLAQNLVEQAACRIDLDDYDGSSALYVQALAEAERAGDFAIRRTAIEGRLAMLARVGMSESVTALQLRQSLDRPDARSA
jgi:tetratricopeptide (TPR) repeat protein